MRSARWVVVAFITAGLLTQSALARDPRRDPVSGRIRILYYGDAFAPSPYPAYVADPLTSVVALTGMTGTALEVDKKMRIFMPRTYKDLLDKYDFIIISDAIVENFRADYIHWLSDSVIKGGVGLIMIGGHYSFGSRFGESPWGETVLQDALPAICPTEGWAPGSTAGRMEIVAPNNVFIRSLPFNEIGPYGVFYYCNIVIPKEGSELIANFHRMDQLYPLLVYQEIGEGASVAMTTDWTPEGGRDFIRWPYYADYALNIASYATGNKIPQDVELAHRVRALLNDYRSQVDTIHSVMDFVASFGVNLDRAEKMLIEVDDTAKSGKNAYIEADLQAALSSLEDAVDEVGSACDFVWKLRYQALIWIYLIEWFVVAATGMICGFILWTIMVKRRLYRETEVTRLMHAREA